MGCVDRCTGNYLPSLKTPPQHYFVSYGRIPFLDLPDILYHREIREESAVSSVCLDKSLLDPCIYIMSCQNQQHILSLHVFLLHWLIYQKNNQKLSQDLQKPQRL